MIRSRRGLITTGAIVFVFGVLILFPARVAVKWFVPAEIAISDIHGSLWNGSAGEASLNGLYLRELSWTVLPLRLFTGKLSYAVAAKPVSGFIESEASISLGGKLSLSQLTAALPLEIFAITSGIRGLQGSASFKFDRVEIVDGLAIVADGVVQIANLIVPLLGRDSLGGYSADFRTQNNAIVASIEDTDGVVDLAGSLQIKTDRSFEFLSQVIVKPETPQSIRQQLKFLPPPDERGQQELRLEGVL